MNDDAQWIIMLGFIISIILVFLALVVNQSALVGKTTAESVLEFPKSEIQDVRAEILEQNEFFEQHGEDIDTNLTADIEDIALERKSAVILYNETAGGDITIHYNDGMTEYNEIVRL